MTPPLPEELADELTRRSTWAFDHFQDRGEIISQYLGGVTIHISSTGITTRQAFTDRRRKKQIKYEDYAHLCDMAPDILQYMLDNYNKYCTLKVKTLTLNSMAKTKRMYERARTT